MQKILVIINPASGSSGDDFRALVEKELRERGAEFEVRETDPEDGGKEIAREAVAAGVTHLIACGGDGTVMSVVNGMGRAEIEEKKPAQPNAILSIIPGGTANLLAGALGIPTDTREAIAVAVAGKEKEIDLGKCGEIVFALGVGLGLTERLVSQASAEEKEKIGKLAYAKAMLRELGVKPTTFSFKLDDQSQHTARGVAVVIANAGQIGGGLAFAPDAKMDDGLLDLCILRRFYFRDVVRMLWHSVLGKLPQDRAVAFYQARRIEIKSEPPLDLQVDGEVEDLTTPLIAGVLPGALRVRVPVDGKNEA
jgi:YegS/Rv2252/BmrU family lipid kinase